MRGSKHQSRHQNKPTPDDLAGIPVCIEEQGPAISASALKTRRRGGKKVRGAPPTADDLAGIPVTAQGKEVLTVRPQKFRQ